MNATPRETMADHVAPFLDGLRASGRWPVGTPDLARAAGLAGERPTTEREWEAFGTAFAEALLEYPPGPEEWDVAGPREILSRAEGNVALRTRYLARDEACPLVRDREAVLEEARAAPAAWEWTMADGDEHRALVGLARLRFLVWFRRFREDEWSQGWMGSGETGALIDHLDREERMGRRIRTGLFPSLDAAIGTVIREFLDRAGPAILRVDGIDARRNAHNVATYGHHAPEGYALVPVRGIDGIRADAEGNTGVRFVRLEEPAFRP